MFYKDYIHDVEAIFFSTAYMYTNTLHTLQLPTGSQQRVQHSIASNALLGKQKNNTVHSIDRALTCNAWYKTPDNVLILKTDVPVSQGPQHALN